MKEFIKSLLGLIMFLCSIYFGLLFIATIITILINLNHLGFAICVFIIMLIMGWMYNIVDSL